MTTDWDSIVAQARALIQGETDAIANAANLSSFLYHTLVDVNWVGFYFLDGDELVVGPYQGRPACTRIALGRGVCGTAAQRRETVVVDDVHAFAGHIPCDAASNAEIVVPLIQGEILLGVLDLDSPEFSRFADVDRRGLEAVAHIFVESCAQGSHSP